MTNLQGSEGDIEGVPVKPGDVVPESEAGQGIRQKTYTFVNMHSGDCRIADGAAGNLLGFNSLGKGSWTCTTWTNHTHSGDKGHIEFWVYTSTGNLLFHLGEFDGPRMDDGNPPPHYRWQNLFEFDANLFDAIGKVSARYSC